MLQSYARQLATATAYPKMMQKHLRNLWHDSRVKGQDLGFEACKSQLLHSINLYDRTTLVLDALDECDPSSRFRLVETIEFLLSTASKPLRVFISSRPDGDIRDRFISLPNIEIQATDNQDDIKTFVNGEIFRHQRWNKMSTQLREEIVETLLTRSQGM